METYGILIIILYLLLDFFLCQPSLVATTELYLIAVFPGVTGTNYRQHLTHRHLSDSQQGICHLFLLILQLFLIRKHLPLTTATYAEMKTEGLYAVSRISMETHHLSFHKTMFFAYHLQINYISRHGKRNKDHIIVYSGKRLPFSSEICYLYVFQYRIFFL